MRPYKVIITGFALAQLEAPSAKVANAILDAISFLETTPHMYEQAEYTRNVYRRFYVKRCRVIYRVDDAARVVHVSWIQPASALPPLESDLEASERT